ncbi:MULTISPECIES: phage tail assembly chaperone [Pseudomonas]|jgi:hypothetical protein|uniref:phage tail assembly chaperone n=1 Tax=Pseudomonas TaxID=286 RepID=UPI00102F3ED1|nr:MULTISPECIES: phage tail assembly chaperone [Pseudomonas]MBH3444954.1 hypothetical protein [Pseudomonas moraviensis]
MIEAILFSPSTCGAYWPNVNSQDIPGDVIPYPLRDWESLLKTLAQSPKRLVAGIDGLPVLIDPPQRNNEQLMAAERVWRDHELSSTDAMVARHRDELESGLSTTLTVDQYLELQLYRRHLRDWPQGDEFPLIEHRPETPGWLLLEVQ